MISDRINKVYCEDNLRFFNRYSDDIDFIYIDPPFFTQRDFKEYTDKWESSKDYLNFIKLRLLQARFVLKKTGVIAVHCDNKANYKIRLILDEVFGEKNFINEIIWEASKGIRKASNRFLKVHETIIIYSKSKNYCFNKQFKPFSEEYKKMFSNKDERGFYSTQPLRDHGEEMIKKLEKEGRIYLTENGKKRVKIYLHEKKGQKITSVWTDINGMGHCSSKERVGYPTQKPLALLDRLIKSFTNEGDLVCDFFCGSGTTLVSAKRLNRNFIGCDINKTAVEITNKRLSEL